LPHLLILEPIMFNNRGGGVAFHLDWRVFLFASALAIATMLLLALVPLMQVARPELLPVLQSASSTRTSSRTPAVRRIAVWLQIGVSFALLVSTGTLVRSFLNTRTQAIGLTRKQVLVAFTQDPDKEIRQTIVSNLRALPGVQNVAYAIRSPLMPSEGGIAERVLLPDHPELRDPIEIKFNAVSPGFLAVTGTRVMRGRGFTDGDDETGPVSVLINRTMAQRYWAGEDPIGHIVRLPGGHVDARVIGVTEDAPINQVGELPEPFLYIPFQQYATHLENMGELTFVIETGPLAMSMAQDVRQALIHINPLLDPMFITSLPELIRYSTGSYQMMAELVTVLALVGLTLTIVGLYGFLAFRVGQRRREIGIRMALGATREATAWLVLRGTATMALAGLTVGVALAIAAARLESAVLFGVRPFDGVSIAAAFVILLVAVAVSAWLPARRAASIDPIQALRTE
jgi:predicted permease